MCNIEEDAVGLGAEIRCFTNGKRTFLGSAERPLIRVGQSCGLLCLVAYGEFLFFAPINSDIDESDSPDALGIERFLCHPATQLGICGPILDAVFVEQKSNCCDHDLCFPILAVLHEEKHVPVGHLGKVRHTCSLSLFCVDPRRRTVSLLNRQSQLPHDSFGLLALGGRHDAICLLSNNALLVVVEEQVYVVPVNAFAAVTVNDDFHFLSGLNSNATIENGMNSQGVELGGSQWVSLAPNVNGDSIDLVGITASGVLLQACVCFALPQLSSSIMASVQVLDCLSVSSPTGLVFGPCNQTLLLSSPERSILFSLLRDTEDKVEVDEQRHFLDTLLGGSFEEALFLSKRTRVVSIQESEALQVTFKEDIALYEGSGGGRKEVLHFSRLQLELLDCLDSVTRVRQATFQRNDDLLLPLLSRLRRAHHVDQLQREGEQGEFHRSLRHLYFPSDELLVDEREEMLDEEGAMVRRLTTPASYIVEREARDALWLCQGNELTRAFRGLPCCKIASRNFPGACRLTTLPLFLDGDTAKDQESFGLLALGYEGRSRLVGYRLQGECEEIVFHELQLVTPAATVHLGIFLSSSSRVVVQIVSSGVRLLCLSGLSEEIDVVQELMLADLRLVSGESVTEEGDTVILGESVAGSGEGMGWVVLVTARGAFIILVYQQNELTLYAAWATKANLTRCLLGCEGFVTSQVLHASVYKGPFPVLSDLSTSTAAQPKESKKRKVIDDMVATEEIALYGDVLSSCGNMSEETSGAEKSQQQYPAASFEKQNDRVCIVIAESDGFLTLLGLPDNFADGNGNSMKLLLRSKAFSSQSDCVSMVRGGSEGDDEQVRDYIIEAKLLQLRGSSEEEEEEVLLALQYETGELAVYQAITACHHGPIVSFHRKLSQLIHAKRPLAIRRGRGVVSDAPPIASSHGDNESYLSSEDYIYRLPTTMSVASGYCGNSRGELLLISGTTPQALILSRGYPVLVALDLPETPYINAGHHLLAALPLPSTAQGAVRCLLTSLWLEYDDVDVLRNPALLKLKVQKASTLEVYAGLPISFVVPSTGLVFHNLSASEDVHRWIEVNKTLTDSRTEQVLLARKTYLLVASHKRFHNFRPGVLAEGEEESEDVQVERYFPELSSFAFPSYSAVTSCHPIVPFPPKESNEYFLALVQEGCVVDRYALPPHEKIVDAIVFYATVEHSVLSTATSTLRHSRGQPTSVMTQSERRILVVASTMQVDIRGEDTQGLGRLLLFALDYALFEDQSTSRSTAENAEMKSESGFVPTASASSTTPGVGNGSNGSGDAFFESIQPKLKLLWAGAGPASVLQQMPALPPPTHSQPVSSASPTQYSNYLVGSVGQTIYIYRLNSDTMELDQVAFYFAQHYVSSVRIVKHYLVVTDVLHSVQLLYFREEDLSLHLVAKDFNRRICREVDTLIDGDKVAFLTSDVHGGLQLFQHQPKRWESLGGSRLICQSEFSVGGPGAVLASHDLLYPDLVRRKASLPQSTPGVPPPPPPPKARRGSSFLLQTFGTRLYKMTVPLNPLTAQARQQVLALPEKKSCVLVAAGHGALGLVIPLEEKMYKRLAVLQEVLTRTIATAFGLNPKDYRRNRKFFHEQQYAEALNQLQQHVGAPGHAMNNSSSFGHNKQPVLDGVLLQRFFILRPGQQEALARVLGVTAAVLRENLWEIDYLSSFF
eukprot:scaffold9796_cov154-Ochromonas_danica.AAC.6